MANMNMVPKKMAPPYLLYTLTTGELPGQVPLNKLRIIYLLGVGRDSSVGTATCYWLEGLGIEYWWGRGFPHASRPALGPTQPPIQWVLGLSGG